MKKQDNLISLNDSQLNIGLKSGLQLRFPILTKLFIGWVYPLIQLAQHKNLELFDIPTTSGMKDALQLYKQFQVQFIYQSESKNALQKSLFYTFKKQLTIITIWQFFMISAQLSTPLLIKLIIEEKQSTNQDEEYLLCLVVLITFSRFVFMLSSNQSKYQMRLLGLDAQNTISVALLQKSLRISFLSNNNYTSAQIINLLSVDAAKLSYVTYYLFIVLIQPILLIYTLILIFIFIGTPFIVGVCVAILSTLVNLYLGKIVQRKQKNVLELKDERTKLTNYIFSFIKFIKINALESFFIDKLFQLRTKEIQSIKVKSTIQAWSIFSSWTSPLLILIATFATIIYTGDDLTTSRAFVIISLFQMIQSPLIAIPQAIGEILQVNVSVEKLQKFLFTNELMLDCIINTPDTKHNNCIKIRDGNFYWPGKLFSLQNINLTVHDKQFVAIVGDVGSGKSSILYALLGEMLCDDHNSKISIQGSMAYVGQNGWLMNDTVRQNILFGNQYNEERYEEAIQQTCLQQDLKVLIKGDQTMIGERGVNLSGGQKIRICLARAIYSKARILLLDDPISALDNYVCQKIMQNALATYLKNTIRILVTHKVQYLNSIDYIYVLKQGIIIEQGSKSKSQVINHIDNIEQIEEQKQIENPSPSKQTEENELLLNEDRQVSNINPIIYKSYFSENGNNFFFLKLLFIQILWILSYVGCLFTLASWSQSQFDDQGDHSQYFIKIYVALSFSQAIFTYLRPYSLVSHCIHFAHKLHDSMINQLIRAGQCEFFERVPVGRILNRFTKDLTVIDSEIYWSISWICSQLSLLIGNIIIYLYSSSLWILLPISLYVYICYQIQKLFTNASTQLQRIESVAKSPIISFFQECISNGLTSIRAYNKQNYSVQKFCQYLDTNRRVGIVLNATSGWFAIILGTASLVLNTIAILLCIFYFESSASKIVLLLTFATTLDQNISDGVQAISRFSLNIVAYERCLEFTKILMEKDEGLDQLNNQWPNLGQIEFKNYSVRYRDGLNTALSHVNLKIEAKDKIGIVGRTGAGKSTFTLALMRLLNPFEGQIEIDGVDICKVPLTLLRTKVSLIMQDACLFTGCLRENLDPFSQHQDQYILEVLQQCCLKNFLKNREGLNSKIQEGGKNLSEGEKQLICIARAVLRQTKIILIDEGTSNLDNSTEEIVQETIQKMFADCTVLTIAHRIQTIKNCNKIIVIEEGEIVEFDETQILLKNEDSKFYGIYAEAK